MTLKRRVLIWLLVVMPAIWILAGAGSYLIAKHEIDELFDTQQLRLAEQALANALHLSASAPTIGIPPATTGHREADPGDLAIAAWTGAGQLVWAPGPLVSLPFKRMQDGFQTIQINNETWHLYYLNSTAGDRVVAVGQKADERDEMLGQMLMSSLAPMILALPLLIFAIALTVAKAFRPLQTLTRELRDRPATDLSPISLDDTPEDLKPLLGSMNALFDRIKTVIAHERRLTADASHELRSPIAALRAQWDAMTLTQDADAKGRAMVKIDAGIDRLSRLVGQLLNLSTLENDESPRSFAPVRWHQIVENAISDVLPLVDQRNGDISVDWPAPPAAPFPIRGDNALLSMMIRNLVDNSLRYGQPGTKVTINIQGDSLQVIDDGPGIAQAVIDQIGERFVRPPGQEATGSGIGLSIVNRVARLHGLRAAVETAPSGTIVTIRPDSVAPEPASQAPSPGGTGQSMANSFLNWQPPVPPRARNDEQPG